MQLSIVIVKYRSLNLIHTAHFTLKAANCTLHIAHHTLHTAPCKVLTSNCTLHTAHCSCVHCRALQCPGPAVNGCVLGHIRLYIRHINEHKINSCVLLGPSCLPLLGSVNSPGTEVLKPGSSDAGGPKFFLDFPPN